MKTGAGYREIVEVEIVGEGFIEVVKLCCFSEGSWAGRWTESWSLGRAFLYLPFRCLCVA